MKCVICKKISILCECDPDLVERVRQGAFTEDEIKCLNEMASVGYFEHKCKLHRPKYINERNWKIFLKKLD